MLVDFDWAFIVVCMKCEHFGIIWEQFWVDAEIYDFAIILKSFRDDVGIVLEWFEVY